MSVYNELLEKSALKVVEEKENFGKFSFEPLPVGFGHTLGTVLRRVLLSSIKGAAVTHAKIEGVTHPFTTVPGVREDVVELLLNIKKIRLKIFNDQPVVLKLSATGPGKVTASDLEVVGDGEVINKDLVIANLADKKSKLSLELTCESGVGYEPSESHPSNKIGVIPVDSVFTPVTNVSYKVGSARLGQITSLDNMLLDVTTDGTVTPQEALKMSCDILRDFFTTFASPKVEVKEEKGVEASALSSKEVKINGEEASVSLEDLGLSTRTTNALLRAKVKTLGDLVGKKEELGKIKGLGQKGITEITELLSKQDWK